jgi:hypothetical protein
MSQTRRFIQPYKIIDATSMGANFQTNAIDISNVDDISIVYEWSGASCVGTLYVLVRNGETSPWSTLDIQPVAAIATNSGNNNIQITNVSFKEIALQYTRSAGTGTISAWLTGKGR